jgi:histidinol phosphatase-like PHP family hydrolase
MKIQSDWHIHSQNSCDEAALVVSDLIREAEAKGIRDYGLTDHLHTPFNLPDVVASREEFLASAPPPQFHFGIEVSCVSQWEIDEVASGRHKSPVYGRRSGGPPGAALAIGLTRQDIDRLHIEYVVGGTHWPMYVPLERDAIIRDYHRQNMFLATHPLVKVVAHPWWWHGSWKDAQGFFNAEPWFDDFRRIPQSMHEEFADAVKANQAIVEINIGAMLLNPHYPDRFKVQYLDYLGELKSRKVRLCTGSDCHSAHYSTDFDAAARMLDRVGIREDDLWGLPPTPGNSPARTVC